MALTITNEDNMALMGRYPDQYFDLAIVDVPYGINAEQGTNLQTRTRFKDKEYGWDNKPPDESYFTELFRVSKKQIMWGANHFRFTNSPNFIIWDKGITCRSRAFSDCEMAWVSPNIKGFGISGGRMFDGKQGMVASNGHLTQNRIHPTQKPISLYKWILDKYAIEGEKILDTHLGSGSIAIACHDYKFDLTACELDKDYFEDAMKRITNHTNQQKLF